MVQQEQAQGLGQAGLPRSQVEPALSRPRSTYAHGAWLLAAGAACVWCGLGWYAESRARSTADRQREAVERDATKHAAALAVLERERDRYRDAWAKSEHGLIEAGLARRQHLETIAELGRRLTAARGGGKTEPASVSPSEAQELRAKVAFLRKLNYMVRSSGGDFLRFHAVGSRDGKTMHDVKLLVLDQEGVPDGLFSADRCRLELDRARGIARIVLGGVVRVLEGKRWPKAKQEVIEFEPVKPRRFELELGEVVTALGAYPVKAAPKPATRDDLRDLSMWRVRFGEFLAAIEGAGRLTLHSLGGVDRAGFTRVEILGYTDKGRWQRRIRAGRFEVWVDLDTDRVEARMTGGFAEDATGRQDFPDQRPYRLPLPGIDRKKASRLLTGFVHRFHSVPK